jgi:hypothetical protein
MRCDVHVRTDVLFIQHKNSLKTPKTSEAVNQRMTDSIWLNDKRQYERSLSGKHTTENKKSEQLASH